MQNAINQSLCAVRMHIRGRWIGELRLHLWVLGFMRCRRRIHGCFCLPMKNLPESPSLEKIASSQQ